MTEMPSSNGKTLLITGITGYVASSLGQFVLSRGYHLRGTSRSRKSTQSLLDHAYKPYLSRVQICEVPDMTVPGAFDEAVQGVHGIFHVASPVNFELRNYDQVVVPAQQGTLGLLNSSLKAGSQLESVTFTSSVATVVDITLMNSDNVFTEHDEASTSLDLSVEAEKTGQDLAPSIIYSASKIAAERALWNFRSVEKPSFSISCVIPGVVIGPPVVPPQKTSGLGVSLQPVYDIFSGRAKTVPGTIGSGSFVDVRDIAYMHLWTFENCMKADGERYLGVAGCGATQAIADILRQHYPDRRDRIPPGNPGEGYQGFVDGQVKYVDYPDGRFKISGNKAEQVMGISWIPMVNSVLDTVKVFGGLV